MVSTRTKDYSDCAIIHSSKHGCSGLVVVASEGLMIARIKAFTQCIKDLSINEFSLEHYEDEIFSMKCERASLISLYTQTYLI